MNRPIPAYLPGTGLDQGPDAGLSGSDVASAASPSVRLHHARLVMRDDARRDGRRFGALTPEGAMWVVPAAGCLLQPEVGDLALVSLAAGQGYILTVLERGAPDTAALLEVTGDLTLSVPAGKLQIEAAGGVSLDAGPALTLNAQQAAVSLDQADIACRSLHAHGEQAHTNWTTRTDVSVERMEVTTRAETHLGESVRRIAGHEDVSAGSQRTVAVEDWSVHSASADLRARDRVAVDAASVQIG